MYIAMDISDSVELKDVESSKKAVISLIKKVRTITFHLIRNFYVAESIVLFLTGQGNTMHFCPVMINMLNLQPVILCRGLRCRFVFADCVNGHLKYLG